LTRYILPILALTLAGCGKDLEETGAETGVIGVETGITDTSTDTSMTTDTGTMDGCNTTECNATVTAISPADGAESVAANVTVVAEFSEPADEANLTVSGPDGAISGNINLASDGLSISFTPDNELARETQFNVEATVCEMTTTSSFTTVEEAITENALIGRVYNLDLNNVNWTSPPASIANLMMQLISTSHMLLLVEDVDESVATLDLAGAAGWENNGVVTQYPCAEAFDFESSDFSTNPYFSAGPADTIMRIGSEEVGLEGLTFDGSFVNEGDSIDNLHVTTYLDGEIDLDEYGKLCDAVAMFGVSCDPCPSDASRECLLLDATAPSVVAKQNLMIDVDIDPSQNPACP